MESIKFVVFGEPVAKGRPRFYQRGNFVGTYTPDKTRSAEEVFLLSAIPYKPKTPFSCALSIDVGIYRPIPKSFSKSKAERAEQRIIRPTTKPDTDNYLKLICDALNKVFWNDDSQIVDICVSKFYSEIPRIKIEIIALEG